MAIFINRLMTIESYLKSQKYELAFNEMQSLFGDVFDEMKKPPVTEEELEKLCRYLNKLTATTADYECENLQLCYGYRELEPCYQKLVHFVLSSSICWPQTLSNMFLEMSQVHYKLGILENSIFLATKASQYASQFQITEETSAKNYITWLEHALEFEALKKYYESLLPQPEIAKYKEFFGYVQNKFILISKSSELINTNLQDFYRRNLPFLEILVNFTKQFQILNSISSYRLKNEKPSLELEKDLFKALRLLKAFLKLESSLILQELHVGEELKFSWELRLYLESQLNGLLPSISYLEKYIKEVDFLKNKSGDFSYWATLIEKDETLTRCELLGALLPPTKEALDNFLIKLDVAYVRSDKKLFYLNKTNRIWFEIKLDNTKLTAFDEKMNPSGKASILSEDQLNAITLITGHSQSQTLWQIHQQRLKQIRNALWQSPAKKVFVALENYRQNLHDLFKTFLIDQREWLPCEWELCLKGSFARGDIHGFSDLDPFLLIDKNEDQLHPYFQMLINRFHHFLLGMGDDWTWTKSPGKELTRDIIESCGLSIDSGDREHLLIDYPRLTARSSHLTPEQKQDFLKKKVRLICTPEKLACWVIDKITQKEMTDDFLSAFSLLYSQGAWRSSEQQGLFQRYQDELQKGLSEDQIRLIGENRLFLGLKKDEFKKLNPEKSSERLKSYLQLLSLVMICAYYCHRKKLNLPRLSLRAWTEGLTGYWHPGFLQAWLKTWKKLHTWRFLCQQRQQHSKEAIHPSEKEIVNHNDNNQTAGTSLKSVSNVLISDLTIEQQRELKIIYQTLLMPFFETLSQTVSGTSNPWQLYAKSCMDNNVPDFATLIQILSVAREAGATVKLAGQQLQSVWNIVADKLMIVWEQHRLQIHEVKDLENLATPWRDLSWGQVVPAIIQAGADPDNLAQWEIALKDVNPNLMFFLIACGAGREPSLGRNFLSYLKKFQGIYNEQHPIQQTRRTLSYFHPDIAWLSVNESIFQHKTSENGELGQMAGVDTGRVYLKQQFIKEIIKPRQLFSFFSKPWKKNNYYGHSDVSCIEVDKQRFFFKWYPEAPDREESVQRLSYHLFGRGVAKGELFAYFDFRGQKHPVWISQGVRGHNAQDVLNALSSNPNVRSKSNIPPKDIPKLKDAFDKIDETSFTIQFLITTLFCQEDGNPSNLILQPIEQNGVTIAYELISIDNDHAYYEPFIVEQDGTTKLQLKSLVYCLNHMKRPLEARIVERFLKSDPYETLQSWLTDLREREQRFQDLFKENEKAHQQSRLTFHFPPHSIPKLKERWENLKKYLMNTPQLPAIELLCKVIPRAGWEYEKALKATEDIGTRFVNISAGQYTTTQIDSTIIHHHTRTRILPLPTKVLQVNASKKNAGEYVSQIEAVKIELEWIYKFAEPFVNQVITTFKNKAISEFLVLFPKLILENYKSRVLAALDWHILTPLEQIQFIKLLLEQAISFEHLTLKGCESVIEAQLEKLLRYSPCLQSLYLQSIPCCSRNLWSMLSRYNHALTTLQLEKLEHLIAYPKVLLFPALTRMFLNEIPCQELRIRAPQLKILRIKNCKNLTRIQTGSRSLEFIKINLCPVLREEGVFGMIEKATKFKYRVWPTTLQWSEPNIIAHYPWLLTYSWNEVQPYLVALKKIPPYVPDNLQILTVSQIEHLYELHQDFVTVLVKWFNECTQLQDVDSKLSIHEKLCNHTKQFFSNSHSSFASILVMLLLLIFDLEKSGQAKVIILRIMSSWCKREEEKEIDCLRKNAEIIFFTLLKALGLMKGWFAHKVIPTLVSMVQIVPEKMNEVTAELLNVVTNEWNHEAREEVIKALGNLVYLASPEKVNEIFLYLLKYTDDVMIGVRREVSKSLIKVAQADPEKASEILPYLLNGVKNWNWEIRQATINALEEIHIDRSSFSDISTLKKDFLCAVSKKTLPQESSNKNKADDLFDFFAKPFYRLDFFITLLNNLHTNSTNCSVGVNKLIIKMINDIPNPYHIFFSEQLELWKILKSADPMEHEMAYILLSIMAIFIKTDFDHQVLEITGRNSSTAENTTSVKNDIDLHWYSDDEMKQLLHFKLDAYPEVEIFDPISLAQLKGQTLSDHLSSCIQPRPSSILTLLIPIQIHDNHWAALYLHYEDGSAKDTLPKVVGYFDPFGELIPNEILLCLQNIYPLIQVEEILESPIILQQNDFSSGAYVVAILESLVREGRLLPYYFDITAERKAQHALLSSNAVVIPTYSQSIQIRESSKEDHVFDQIRFLHTIKETGHLFLRNLNETNGTIIVNILNQIVIQKIPLQVICLNHLPSTVLPFIAPLLTKLIRSSSAVLEVLNLSNNDWSQISVESFQNMVTALTHCTWLKELILNKAGIGFNQANLLFWQLNPFFQLESILLGNNSFSDEVIGLLLENTPVKLKELSLSGNVLSLKSVDTLAKWLGRVPTTFERLYLSRCHLDSIGLKRLLDSICSNSRCTLKEVCLDNNYLDDKSIVSLLELLDKRSPSTAQLECLIIKKNLLSWEGLKQFQKELHSRFSKLSPILRMGLNDQLQESWLTLLSSPYLSLSRQLEGWEAILILNPDHSEAKNQMQKLAQTLNKHLNRFHSSLVHSESQKNEDQQTLWQSPPEDLSESVKQLKELYETECNFLKKVQEIRCKIMGLNPRLAWRLFEMLAEYLTLTWPWGKLSVFSNEQMLKNARHLLSCLTELPFLAHYATLLRYTSHYSKIEAELKALQVFINECPELIAEKDNYQNMLKQWLSSESLLKAPFERLIQYESLLSALLTKFQKEAKTSHSQEIEDLLTQALNCVVQYSCLHKEKQIKTESSIEEIIQLLQSTLRQTGDCNVPHCSFHLDSFVNNFQDQTNDNNAKPSLNLASNSQNFWRNLKLGTMETLDLSLIPNINKEMR